MLHSNVNEIANASNRVSMEVFGLESGYLTIPSEAFCKVRLQQVGLFLLLAWIDNFEGRRTSIKKSKG